VLPEREGILNAILDPTTPATYRNNVSVRTVPSTFDAQAQDPIVAVLVKFERGDSVVLEPTTLKANATVRLPIHDWLARKEDPGQYRYRVTVIRRSGQQAADSDWRTDSGTILFPDLSR
jgi:hypothetical protein